MSSSEGLVRGMAVVDKAKAAADEAKLEAGDIVVVAVHTPEGVDKAKTAIEKKKLELPVLLDGDGEFCDALGAYKKPVAFIVDRQGNIRYGGLSDEGITGAAKELAAKIAANGPLAVAVSKQIITESADWSSAEMFQKQGALATPVFSSDDAREGATAFAEKRTPNWTGK